MIDLNNLDWLTSEQASAVRKLKHERDKFGLTLMMIREGCKDPRELARDVLNKIAEE